MIISLIPGVGAVAYVASGTMIKNGLARVLLDQGMHKLPFGLYSKLRLERILAPRPAQPVEKYPKMPRVPALQSKPVPIRSVVRSLQIAPPFPVSKVSGINLRMPKLALAGSNGSDIWQSINGAHGPPVPT